MELSKRGTFPIIESQKWTSLSLYKRVILKFLADDVFTQGAALALYTAFSLAPLMILMISFLSTLQLDLQTQLLQQVQSLMGSEAASVLNAIIDKAESRRDLSTISGWVGSLTLFFSASVIFAQLQSTLNSIFHSEIKKDSVGGWIHEVRFFVIKRLISFGIVLSFIFISIVSLLLSSLLSLLIRTQAGRAGEALNILLSFGIFALVFSAIFKWIPDRPIATHAAMKGGLITAFLFMIGKTMIGFYLGQAAVGSAYGAAGSIIVLLFWVYYSSLIIFFGAEIASVMPVQSSAVADSSSSERPYRKYFSGNLSNRVLQRVRRTPAWILWTLGFLLIIRAALPILGLRAINYALETKLSEYTGHIKDFDLSLYRGAYQLQGLEIKKRDTDLPPLLTVAEIDLALAWRSLLRKEISGDIRIQHMSLQVIDNKNAQQKQSGLEENKNHWQDVFDVLIPISIESLRVENSSAYFTNTDFAEPIPIRLEEMYLEASNLRSRSKDLESPFYMRAILQRHAPIQVKGKMSILASPRQYDVEYQLEKFNISSLNQIFIHYIPLNITSGEASFYGEAKSKGNDMKGYVKFFLKDGDIVAPDQKFVSGRHFIYEIISAFGNWILKNNKTHKVAALVPFEYTNGKFNINGSEAFWSAVKNSWNELKPGIGRENRSPQKH